jgi:diguanylate cyclase (GGDEF)-like protein/PAS domain S-box-containing protein
MEIVNPHLSVTVPDKKTAYDKIYMNLARNGLLWENNLNWFLRRFCKTISDTLKIERVGVYIFSNDRSSLRQQTLYSASSGEHTFGLNLKKRNYPKYFQSLIAAKMICADDAHSHPVTSEFSHTYLIPLDIGAKLDLSLHKAGKVTGVLSVEHLGESRQWLDEEKQFLGTLAELISQRLLYEDMKMTQDLRCDVITFNGEDATLNLKQLPDSGFNETSPGLEDTILKTSPFSIISLDSQGVIQSCNQAGQKLFGLSENGLLAIDFCSLLISPPDQAEIITLDKSMVPAFVTMATLKEQLLQPDIDNCECFIRHCNGKAIPVKLTLSEFKSPDGVVSGYVCTVADISKQVSIRRALQAEEQRYRFVFEGSADSIFLMKDKVFSDCNQATLNMFGCTREQIIGETPQRFSPEFQPDGRPSGEKAFEKITAAFSGVSQTFEWLHSRYDGSTFDAEVTLNKVEVNKQPYLMATVRDISQRKISERELKQSRHIIVEHNRSLALINDLSNQLHAIDSVDDIYTKTVNALENLPHCPRIGIFTVHPDKKELHLKMSVGHQQGQESKYQVIPLNPEFTGFALKTGEPLYSPDISKETRMLPAMRKAFMAAGLNSIAEIPLVYQDNQMAVITLTYDMTDCLEIEDIEALHSIGKTVSLALANAESRSKLQYIAHHDSLTGLTNRSYLHDHFQARMQEGEFEGAALYLLDLDRFKEINDTLGHFTGDKILQQIGPRLSAVVKDRQFNVSRLGGDEFVIIAYGVNTDSAAKAIAENIIGSLNVPFIVDDLKLEIDASVGIARYPNDGDNSHALLRSADVAMYQAKSIGGGFAFYNRDEDVHTPERLAMIAELGSSINSGQLFLHYQPKVELKTNTVTGFEALARWNHPRLGLLGPNMFIPLIEMSNSIATLTEEVLRQALAQQQQWREAGFDYSVAVNISARNLIDDHIIGVLAELMERYETPPGKLELEITETALMHDAFRSVEFLNQLSAMGIQLSIDDFGTGYSSLAYLRNLPIDKLKLDREFIMGMLENQQGIEIVQTIINLSKTLNLEVIAEGVEDADTLDQLKLMNCDKAQGYFICRPATWDKIDEWLTTRAN